ncbi:MAG: polyprenyl synthetase family protein [Chloroflexota bacterium]
MISETALTLVVPPEKKLREDIRQNVDQHFAVNRIIPPVSYNKLAEMADSLLEKHGWDRSYKAFVMVCSGNSIWRPVVGAIPFKRRMLLLPQCLKNSNMCKGVQDELGLLCAECGNCNISGFLREAEKLGYLTVVSEGTTIASRLVESGKVDAVIGVGCMEVLQKMFVAVNKYSVPSIGVPLLSCGCIDTTADAAWIRQEINHLEDRSGYRFLNLNDMAEKVKSFFTEEQISQVLNLTGTATDQIIKEVLLAGGKRIRPLLTALAFEAFSDHPDQEVMKKLAFSVECFHKASLIHDDIEDDDPTRYGKQTLHTKYGVPVAINSGDLLIGEGYRLITECKLDPAVITKCIRVISKGHKAMSVGQGAELIARRNNDMIYIDDLLEIFENKSAEAFRVALLMGAVAAGADERTLNLLDNFSSHIGRAYQLKDDLEDLPGGNDFSAVKNPSALISVLLASANEEEMSDLQAAVKENDYARIHHLFSKYDVAGKLGTMIREHLNKLDRCLSDLQNIPLKIALYEIVGRTFRDYL